MRVYLRPLGLGDGSGSLRLAGGPLRFDRIELVLRREDGTAERVVGTPSEMRTRAVGLEAELYERLERLTRPLASWAGLALDRPVIMGVVNVTPDSFSDGGDFVATDAAVAQGRALREAGADILDIGGESTRPGAEPVAVDEELRRVVPVVAALAGEGAVVSVDTRHAAVMAAAIEAGAAIVNDVTALAGDPDSLATVARSDCAVVLMHMRGEPRTMQQDPVYADVALDVHDALAERVEACVAAGVARQRIAVDPGIGFGKTVAHNLALLRQTALFHDLGCPVLVGVSRKRFIGTLSRGEPPKERGPGSLAAGLAALDRGAQILRVHDVAPTAQARAVWLALHAADTDPENPPR